MVEGISMYICIYTGCPRCHSKLISGLVGQGFTAGSIAGTK